MNRRGFNGSTDQVARYNIGALEQRVYGLEQGVAGLSNQIAGLSQQIASGSKTNWPVIIGFGGFALSVIAAIGTLAYWPVRESQTDLKAAVAETVKTVSALANQTAFQINAIGKEYVSVRELEQRSGRTRQEVDRLNVDMTAQDANIRRSMEQADANLQRQIDDQKKAFGDTFSLRDALQQMRREIDDLKRRPAS